MTLKNKRDLASTQEKLRLLEAQYEDLRETSPGGDHLRDLTLQAMERLIEQVSTEVETFMVRQPAVRV